jgi:hypothetical protein
MELVPGAPLFAAVSIGIPFIAAMESDTTFLV